LILFCIWLGFAGRSSFSLQKHVMGSDLIPSIPGIPCL